MNKENSNHLKLGIFVAAGAVLLIIALYLIGSKRNVFSSTIKINALFYNVSGLMPGNNVRYAGIDVGTVDKVVIENDSTVNVYMMIVKNVKDHIKKNAIAAIGTDGLMGNKLVNITPVPEPAPPIEEGDMLQSLRGVESEEMIRTLSITNDNVAAITKDLRLFTSKINNEKGIVNVLSDSSSAENIKRAFAAFNEVAQNTRQITENLNGLVDDLKHGKGLAGSLLNDTSSAYRLKNTIKNLEQMSDSLNLITKQFATFSSSLNNPHGLVSTLTNDTTVSKDMKVAVSNLKQSTELLNEDLRALQDNWLFRKYFKDKEAREKKEKKEKEKQDKKQQAH